jgi:hypothetical protein
MTSDMHEVSMPRINNGIDCGIMTALFNVIITPDIPPIMHSIPNQDCLFIDAMISSRTLHVFKSFQKQPANQLDSLF